jgi:hypothetical protein
MSPIQHRGALRIGLGLSGTARGEQGDALDILEEDIIQSMIPIPYTSDDNIPMQMRRHNGGGGGYFM